MSRRAGTSEKLRVSRVIQKGSSVYKVLVQVVIAPATKPSVPALLKRSLGSVPTATVPPVASYCCR